MKKFLPVMILALLFALTACGPSAEEQAKEQARINEEVSQLKAEINQLHRIKAMGPPPLFNWPLTPGASQEAIAKHEEEQRRKNEAQVKEYEKKRAEAESRYNTLVKKLKDEYGIAYKPQ